MRVVHEPADDPGGERILAREVDVADSLRSQARGLMFRSSIPDEYALVLEVGSDSGLLPFSDGPSRQLVHMLFVRFPIDVLWLVDDRVTKTASLSPWTGLGIGRADRILELPAGRTDGVSVGDVVRVDGLDD